MRRSTAIAAAFIAALALGTTSAQAQGTLRIGMTSVDVPTTGGIPNNGGEGYRFLGFPAYDALVNWELKEKQDDIANVRPGLAESWSSDPKDRTKWVFKLRSGVKFHDGSAFTADAVMFNMRRVFDEKAPEYDAPAAPIVKSQLSMVDRWEKIDDMTIAIYTKTPFAYFPYMITRLLMVSPTQYEKVGKNWVEFGKAPSGTGPFKITKVTPRVSAELAKNADYWDKDRIPKLDRMILYPMPEPTTRLAALRSGQVDWIEVPPPDAIQSLKQAGFEINLKPYPHTWPYVFNTVSPKSPFTDKRVRQAMNYAVDRQALVQLLNGTAKPAAGLYPPESTYFGKPENRYSYDPEKAKALLKEAGYGPGKPVKAKIMVSTAGSGQMLPLPMNELIQQMLKPIGIELDFEVVEWGTMLVAVRSAPDSAPSMGVDAINISLGFADPSTMYRYYHSDSKSPTNWNWAHFSNPKADALLMAAQTEFDEEKQLDLLAKAHAIIVDEAPWLFIVHDLNPRALSKKVVGFSPAQSWSQDFTTISMAK
ncbi:ABC transporter substrate-binding protein [Bosea caraganae]|nr:ABC transporter substrate-binding protein [Bosea caraganae]